MSAKKKRAWFVCPQWQKLIGNRYPSDAEAAKVLHTDPKVIAKMRLGTPVAKSTMLKILRQVARRHHPLGVPAEELVVDTRLR